MNRMLAPSLGWLAVMSTAGLLAAAEPVTIENVVDPGANQKDEPIAERFSLDRAVHFLDSASLNWQKQRKCFTCHTNYAYLYARPSIPGRSSANATVREFAYDLVERRWREKGPRWDAEVVATAAALAFNDEATFGTLHPVTSQALDRIESIQRADGGFNWLKCNWPPFESDDHYGVTLAAIAIGVAPDGYADTPRGTRMLAGIRRYLKAHPAPTMHHKAMILWAGSYLDGLVTDSQKQQAVKELLALQKDDGGWGLATLGEWKRSDETPQDTASSDGYGTGFMIYVLRRSGVPAADKRIGRGIAWLKSHQRQSGRWFTRSLNRDNHHFITHAGTAFAVMALGACDEIKTAASGR